LTPGEVMQLPQDEAIVLVSGLPPIRAKKLRHYYDHAVARFRRASGDRRDLTGFGSERLTRDFGGPAIFRFHARRTRILARFHG
jgi:hypothetical protein